MSLCLCVRAAAAAAAGGGWIKGFVSSIRRREAAGMDFIKPVEATKASVEKNDCYIVSPDQAVEMIEKYVEATGSNRFYTWAVPPGLNPRWSDEHIELMSDKVIPEFKN